MRAVVFWLVPLAGLLYFAVTSYNALTERKYPNANAFTGELVAGHSVGQTFVSRYNGLDGVELRLGTYGPGALAGAVLHLRTAPGAPDIATVAVPASDMRGENPWHTFSFPAISNSQDRSLYLEIESPDAAPGKAFTLFWWKQEAQGEGDPYPLGVAYIDGKPRRGDLAFGLRYSPSPLDAFAQEARAISTNAQPFLVVMLGALIVVMTTFLAFSFGKPLSNPKSKIQNPKFLALLTIALAHGLLYSLLVPLWQGPDEPSHFAYAALLYSHNLDNKVVQSLNWNGKDNDQALVDAITRSMDSHDFTRLVAGHPQPGASAASGTTIYSEMRQPAAYYWLCAAAMRATQTDPYTNTDNALRLMRLVSLLLSLGVVALAWLAGIFLFGSETGSEIQNPKSKIQNPLLPLTVALLPMHAFSSSIANNDILAELVVSALVVTVIALFRWPRGWRGLLLAASVVVLALVSAGTKSSALAAAIPLMILGLLIWAIRFWILDFGFWKTKSNPKSKIQNPKSLVLSLACLLAVIIAIPLLFTPQGTAAGWKLNNLPSEKAPVAASTNAHGGQRVLFLPAGANASQQIALYAPPAGMQLLVAGYARLHPTDVVTRPVSAVVRLESAGVTPARAGLQLTAESGWVPFSTTLTVVPGAANATVKLFAKGAPVEFDDFRLSYSSPAPLARPPTLLNPSFEREEVALRGSIASFLPQEARWIAEVAANPQTFDKPSLWGYYASEQFRSFWGNFGWVSVPLPGAWYIFWLVISAVALIGLFWRLIAAKRAWDWQDWLRVVFLGSFAAAVCFGFARQMMALAVFGVEAYPQGRYLFVLGIPITWLILDFGFARINPKSKIQNPKSGWVWANLLLWFAAFALGGLVMPYYYGS